MNSEIRNTSDLRKILTQTIEGVRAGTIQPSAANSIAGLSTKILQSARLDLDFMRFNRESGKKIENQTPEPLKLT